jgi:hypothetical protein
MDDIVSPRLIEQPVKQYMGTVLQNCHSHRSNIYYYVLNISIFLIFVLIFGISLYYCYSNKKTPYELQQKMTQDQNYILSKIRYYQDEQKKLSSTKLTNLPML